MKVICQFIQFITCIKVKIDDCVRSWLSVHNCSFASIRLSIQFFPHFMGIGIDWKFLARRDCTMGVQQYQRKKIWCLWSDLNYKTCKMHHCQLHVPGTLSFLNICGHQFWIWEKSTIFRIKFKFVNINHVNGPTHQY